MEDAIPPRPKGRGFLAEEWMTIVIPGWIFWKSVVKHVCNADARNNSDYVDSGDGRLCIKRFGEGVLRAYCKPPL